VRPYDFEIQPSLGQLLWLEVRRVGDAGTDQDSLGVLQAFDLSLVEKAIK
jgi:hypothetical protein